MRVDDVSGNGSDGRYCSPRCIMPFKSRHEGSTYVSMTWRAISARPDMPAAAALRGGGEAPFAALVSFCHGRIEVQVEPRVESAWIQRLKRKCHYLLSSATGERGQGESLVPTCTRGRVFFSLKPHSG